MCPTTHKRLESLSNELLLDIFEYLDAYNLCQAFYGLNHRINKLLQSAHLHMRYDSSKENKRIWDTLKSFFNPSQIRILSYSDYIDIDERILSCNENLHSIRLHDVSRWYIDRICQHVSNENHIKCLSVNAKWQYIAQDTPSLAHLLLVDHGHRFVSLVNLSLSPLPHRDDFPLVQVTFLHLRRLSIKGYSCTENLFQFFQDNTPNLRSLRLSGSTSWLHPISKFGTKHLHELHLDDVNNLPTLQSILSHFPYLRRLHIAWIYNRRCPVINGSQCQQLIETYLPHLKRLTIDFDQGIDEDILKTFYTGEFWSTKKVNAKMVLNKTESRYRLLKTIYFGKEWHFGYFDNM